MIELNDKLFVGEGVSRSCFRHPLDTSKCIKVDVRKHGGATEKEAHYYKKLARIRPTLGYTQIPRFYGFIDTNLGRGGVFDLIQDEGTMEVSKSLRHYIITHQTDATDPVWIKAHQDFVQSLLEDAIVVRDLNAGNVSARKMLDGSFQLISIDGIGHGDFFPLCDFLPWAARRKLKRNLHHKDMHSLAALIARVQHREKIGKKRPHKDRPAGFE